MNPPTYDSSIVHIDIANSTIESLGYYFPRRYYAQVVSVLSKMEFSAIAFDILFAQKVNMVDDSLMVASVREANRVYLPVAFSLENSRGKPFAKSKQAISFLDSTSWRLRANAENNFYFAGTTLLSWPDLVKASRGVGFISVRPDIDGVYRRVPLLIRYKGDYYPSMIMRLVCDYWKVSPDKISIDTKRQITLHDAIMQAGKKIDVSIPVDENGNMLINWIGGWGAMRHVGFIQLLDVAQDREEIAAYKDEYAGSIGLVGDVSTGISDTGPTPFENNFPLVGLHSNVLNTILTRQFLQSVPEFIMTLIEICIATCIAIFSMQYSSVKFTTASVMLVFIYLVTASLLFIYMGVIVEIVRPLMLGGFAVTAIVASRYITEEKEKEKLRSKFETYFPPSVVKQMIDNPNTLSTKPHKQEVTVMFSDIKSFTTYSSTKSPEEISATLNEYFGVMTEIVFKYGGTVDKFIGDGLMVFYGAPEPQSDHALRCVKAAIDMQRKCAELRAKWEPAGRLPLRIRIGINTGYVVVGDLGSTQRMEYTVLGSDVNLAQRLESNAPVGGILISESTYLLVKDFVRTKKLEPIHVKGLEKPIVVFEVLC